MDGHDTIKYATSILDYVFRSLGYDYLNRTDFVHVKAVDEIPPEKNVKNLNGKNGSSPKKKIENNNGSNGDKAPYNNDVNNYGIDDRINEKRIDNSEQENESKHIQSHDLEFISGNNGSSSEPRPQNGSTSVLRLKDAKKIGYTGEQCSYCGSIRVKRNGSCTVCEDCGGTSGCS